MNMKKSNGLDRKRIVLTISLFCFAALVLITKLGYDQIVNPEKYGDRAVLQQQKDEIIKPLRGSILDRNGKELAVSLVTYDILIEKIYVGNPEETAVKISEVLEVSPQEFMEKYKDDSKRFYIAKNVSFEKAEQLKAQKLYGLKYEENSQRVYPYGQFASYILGHISSDNEGLAGIEAYLNTELKGIPGRKIVLKDGSNREIPDSEIRFNEAQDGYNIVLTVDEVIQHHVEKVVNQAYIDYNAVGVTAIVMNPKNGEIIAMASKPDYDPNKPRVPVESSYIKEYELAQTQDQKSSIISRMWRNPAVNDIYEPGSPFKLITSAAVLEEDKVSPEERFYDKGYITVNDRKIKNWTNVPYGNISFINAVEDSVNTVFVEVANRIGPQVFLDYINSFGYGEKTGIEIPGEATGILYNMNNLGPVELATMSFGQSISVTPIQMANAVSAIANGGKLLKPTLVKEIRDKDGNLIDRHQPEVIRTPISYQTASEVLSIMESVVNSGGGSRSKIEGYRVAGKSGTAQKVIDGKYQVGAYIGSFVGVAPVEDPELVVLCVVDEPRGGLYYGGSTAAPVVKEILEYSLRYFGINPDNTQNKGVSKIEIPEIRGLSIEEAKNKLAEVGLNYKLSIKEDVAMSSIINDCFPKPGEEIAKGSEIILYIDQKASQVKMPDLIGKTIDESDKILSGLGLNPSYVGEGKVISQAPQAGSNLKQGTVVSIELG